MARTYDRETHRWRLEDLQALVAAGQAQWYPAQGGIYVVKSDQGTFAVRQHQIEVPEVIEVKSQRDRLANTKTTAQVVDAIIAEADQGAVEIEAEAAAHVHRDEVADLWDHFS